MILAVLDYQLGCIDIIRNIPENIEEIENFVYNELDYKDSEISWILLEDDFQTNLYTYDSDWKKKVYDNDNFIN